MSTTTAEFSNGYALLIGVGNYLHASPLPVTADDATVLYKLFTNPLRAGYPPDQVKLLVNEQASAEGIVDGLDWLINCVRNAPDATVLVYFSGHGGLTEDNTYILLPFDFKWDGWQDVSISKEVFASKINLINTYTRKLLVFLDCCHASGITSKQSPEEKFFPSNEVLYKQLKQGAGKVVVAACRANQLSYIFPGALYSAFTNFLVDALDRTGDNGKGYATVMRTLTFVFEETEKASRGRQTPVVEMEGAEDFAICRINTQLASEVPFKKTDDYTDRTLVYSALAKTAVELTPLPAKPSFFLGRNKQLKEIHDKLTDKSQRQNILLLSGVGGMGKTTLMREYLYTDECLSAFKAIAFVAVNKNLESAFIEAAAQALGQEEAIRSLKHPEEKLKYLADKMHKQAGNNLFVIDNINERDFEDLKRIKPTFVNTGWKFLITTRTIPDGFAAINVDELGMEDAKLLFAYHFAEKKIDVSFPEGRNEKLKKYIADSNIENVLQQLLDHIVRHTLLTELLAKAAATKGLSMGDLLKILEEQDYKHPGINRTIIIEHADFTFREQLSSSTLHIYLLSLFETEYLTSKTGNAFKDRENDAKATMLRFFSVLPPADIPIMDLKELWRVDKKDENPFEDRLDELRQIGWIQGGQQPIPAEKWYQNLAYKMHPLVQDVVYEKLEPNIDNCRPLVKTITEALNNPDKYSNIFKMYAKSVIDNLNILKKKYNNAVRR